MHMNQKKRQGKRQSKEGNQGNGKEKSRVLFVINTLGYGGAERAMLDLFGVLDPSQYEIFLYVLTNQGELVQELPEYVTLLNPNFQPCSVLTKQGRRELMHLVLRAGVKKGMFIRRAPYLMKNLVRMKKNGWIQADKLCWRILSDAAPHFSTEYDLAVAYLEGGSTYYVADHVRAKKKAAFVHIDYGRAGYCRELDLDCYTKFDRIFAVSKEVQTHFTEVYPELAFQTDVFENRINPTRINRLAMEPGGFDDGFEGFRILTVGRLTAQKSYDVAIGAMALLKEKPEEKPEEKSMPVRWYVLGEGELRSTIEQWIKEKGLEKDFILLGVKKNPFPYYRMADLYVHATAFEGKSIAIREAQVLGKPVIAADCSGNREQIEDGEDGILCQLTPQAVSEAIRWMISHPQKRSEFGKKAQEKAARQTQGIEKFQSLIES